MNPTWYCPTSTADAPPEGFFDGGKAAMKQPTYTIVVEPDSNGWLAYIPALPACYAPGDTVEDALRELHVVYDMIMEEFAEEGRPLPPDVAVTASARTG